MALTQEQLVVGRIVCIIGVGSDALAHRHARISRVTKTMVVTDGGDRFRRHHPGMPSVPYSAYGGVQVHAACQKPEVRK